MVSHLYFYFFFYPLSVLIHFVHTPIEDFMLYHTYLFIRVFFTYCQLLKNQDGDLPIGPVAKTSCPQCRVPGLDPCLQIPVQETTQIPQWFSSVQSLSRVRLFATPWSAPCQASLSITNSGSLLKLMSIKSVMPSNYLIFIHPILLLPSIFPNIRVFSNESVLCIRWQKDWSSSFSISPSNEYSGLISFSIDQLDLLAVQGTLKSLL